MGGRIDDRAGWAFVQHARISDARPTQRRESQKRARARAAALALLVFGFALILPVALRAAPLATAVTTFVSGGSSQVVDATPVVASSPASSASSASPAASSAECAEATVTALAEADAWIAEGTTSNKGSDGTLEVEANPSSGNARALVRFRLPSGGVPQGCVVKSARLRLFTSSGSEGAQVEAVRLASSWSENQVVWSNQPGTVGSASSAWSTDGYMHWNVTSQVRASFEGSSHGFQIRDAAEEAVEGGSGHGFNSKEKGEDPPQLVIRFAAPSSGMPPALPAAPTAGILRCGQVLTQSTRATNNLSECPGNGLVIGADNIIVDLAGHTIDGVGLGTGVLNDGFSRATVTNGTIQDFDYGVELLSETELNVIERLNVRENEVAAIELFDTRSGNAVRENTIEDNGGGIALVSGTTGTVVTDNTMSGNSGAGLLVVDSNDNLLERNRVSGSSDLGIGLERSSGNTLLENVISENSDGGIEIRFASDGNRVEGNDVSDSGDTGIMVAESDRNELISNATRRMSDSGITLNTANDGVIRGNDVRFSPGGVQMDGSSRNVIESNDASETSGIGIELGGGSYDNDLVLNRANDNGATGIYVSDEALTEPGNLLDRNTANGNGSDGITVAKGGHTIVGNVVRNNKSWGINATGANIDGLFNVATGNGQGQQCSGVVCKADWLPPETDISSGPADSTNSTSASFVFGAEDDSTAAMSLQFECRLDAASFAACSSPKTYTGLTPGQHMFEARARDASGSVDPSPATWAWTIDTTPPETMIDSGPTGLTNDAAPTFTFSAAEQGASFECRVDAAPFSPCTSPHTTDTLDDGVHTFEVRALDVAGNADATPASRGLTIDTTAPETTIDTGPSELTRATSASITFSANEPVSFECSLDDADYSACASPLELSALVDGEHGVQVRATDAAGNVDETPSSREWTVDTTPPDTTIDSGPDGPTGDSTPTFGFSSEAGAHFECALDAGAFGPCTSPYMAAVLAEGAHTFQVRALDAAGNTDPTPAGSAFSVDITPPETSLDAGSNGPTNASSPTFGFSSEAGASFECAVDDVPFAACTSPHTTSALAEGPHTFRVRAVDPAGNADPSPASRAFALDTTAPDTRVDSGPAGLTTTTSASFGFSATEAVTFECRLDESPFAPCTSPQLYSAMSDGEHTFEVRATDAAGNADESAAARDFTVDTIAPETTIESGPAGVINDSTPTFEFTANESGGTFACRMDAAPFAACTSPYASTALADGGHTFEVKATDAAGNEDATPVSRSFTVDTSAPETAIDSGPVGLTNDSSVTFAFSSEEGARFECALDTGAFAPCTSPHPTSALADGAHAFSVRAVDAAGNTDATPASRAITVDATAPETTIDSGPSGVTTSTGASFAFSSGDGGANFECKLDDGAFASCTSPHLSSGLGDGGHTFQVRATDAAGNVDESPATRTWTVDTTAPLTTIDSGPASPTTSTSATFDFSSSESGSTFACSLDGGAFATCVSPREHMALAVGSHQFQVRATDAVGNTDPSPATFAWMVQAVDTTAPQTAIGSGPSGPTSDTTPTFTFSSEPGATFECRVDTTAYVSCTSPHTTAALSQGVHAFEVRASDAAGNVDATPANRAFTVDTAAPVTTIAFAPSDPTTQRSASFTFSANETALRFECALDTTAFTTCSSGIAYAGPLALGDHEFRVRGVDPAGNVGAADSHTWTIEAPPAPVDATPPVITLTGPPSGTQSTSASFTFSANESASFRCRLDAATFDNCSSSVGTSYIGLQPGEHVFRVEATDLAGNVSTANHTWTIVAQSGCTGGGTVVVVAIADSWVLQSSATSNYGNDSVIKVDTKQGANARALVRFTQPVLPSGCRVVTATLRLYAGSHKQGRTLDAVALGAAWNQGTVTWNNQPAATGPAATAASRGGYVEWAVAQQVASMYSSANNGFLIRDATENGQGVEQGFNSREKGTDSPPQLVVTFGS